LELSKRLSFRESIAHLKQEIYFAAESELLDRAAAFYHVQLQRHPEAAEYLQKRGLRDSGLIIELGLGYAPGGNLRRHLAAYGYSLGRLSRAGLINAQGRDAFCRRIIFPCHQQSRVINLYGRSIGDALPHRLLPRSKGGLFAWESVSVFSTVILVEGLFDLAVLWQAGFRNTTCAIGTQVTPAQMSQLGDQPGRHIDIAFDQDSNQAGQQLKDVMCTSSRTPEIKMPLPPAEKKRRQRAKEKNKPTTRRRPSRLSSIGPDGDTS
jgi:DNA primase